MASKVVRTFPMKYDSKVSTLEERDDIDLMTVDELHGILTTYEMRMRLNESSRKEATFFLTQMDKKKIMKNVGFI